MQTIYGYYRRTTKIFDLEMILARVIYDDYWDIVSLIVIVDCQSYYCQLTCFCRHTSDLVS
jgi:hypothetical protein